MRHPGVHTIAFTGSGAVGLEIVRTAAETPDGQRHVKRVIAEMGGKNAVIVDSDADLDDAVPAIVRSAFVYAGQKCSAAARVLAHHRIAGTLTERLAGATSVLQVGQAEGFGTDVPPVIEEEARDRIEGYAERAAREGRIAARREPVPANGWFAAPTVAADLPPDSSVLHEEIFGPLLAVESVKDVAAACDVLDASPHALTGGLFSRDPQAIEEVTRRTPVGNLYVNRHITGAMVGRQPFGETAAAASASRRAARVTCSSSSSREWSPRTRCATGLSSSSRIRFHARRAAATALDAAGAVTRRRDPLAPPRRLLSDDYSEFERIGNEFLGHFVELGGLQPGHRVLDIGCGLGRMAVPLTRYMSAAGSYEGFDVVEREVDWCRRAIGSRHPNFEFQVLDVHNERYNPGGSDQLAWPFGDETFDFAIATSVFTHLRPPDTAAYLAEVGRVLRPGGTLFATLFLLDEDTRPRIERGESHFSFPHADGPAAAEDEASFEAAVAYDLDWLRERLAAAGLTPVDLRHGYWSGTGHEYLTWQDVVVARRG